MIRDEILRFFEHLPELADAMIPFQEHQDDIEPERVAEQFHVCVEKKYVPPIS